MREVYWKLLLNLMIRLLEKYFEDSESITEREILDALRAATIEWKIIPMMCGSAFKNKGVQTMLDMVMEFYHPSR